MVNKWKDVGTLNLINFDTASNPTVFSPKTSSGSVVWSGDALHTFTSTSGATFESLDLTKSQTVGLYVVPTGLTAIMTAINFRCLTATSVTVDPVISLGVVTTSDLLASQTLVQFRTAGEEYVIYANSKAVIAPAGSVITLTVVTPATATTLLASIDLVGYEF